MSKQIDNLMRISEMQEENGRDEADYLSFMPGQRLKKARELRGMSVEQVARELNLTPRYVQAMEADSYKDLPEPAFVRGYMRRYAQLVKLSPDDIAAKFDQCYAEDKATPAPDVRPHNPIQVLGIIARRPKLRAGRLFAWLALAFILVLVAGFLWNGFVSRGPVSVVDEPALPTEPPVTVPVPVTPGSEPAVPGTATPPSMDSTPPATTPAPATPAPAPGMNVLPAPSGPAVLPAPGAAVSAPAPAVAALDTLVITLSAESWVSVRDARQQQLVSALSSPRTLTLKGQAPFNINIGNAPAATVSINDKPVDLRTYTRGAVATLTVAR